MPRILTNRQMVLLSRVSIKLDKLQVELDENTPYETPSIKEIHKRILEVMDILDKIDE